MSCKYFLRFPFGNPMFNFHWHGTWKTIEKAFGDHIKRSQHHILPLFLNQKYPITFFLSCRHFRKPISAVPFLYLTSKKNNVEINMARMLYQQKPMSPYLLLTSAFFTYCHLSMILPCHVLLWMQVLLSPTCHVLSVRKATCIPAALYK